jgi:hypothetical protein
MGNREPRFWPFYEAISPFQPWAVPLLGVAGFKIAWQLSNMTTNKKDLTNWQRQIR